MPNTFGPSFESELAAAGLFGLPFVWYPDGTVSYGEDLSAADRATLDAVVAAHSPDTPTPVPVPESVTKYQCVVVLARHGVLEATNAFFAGLPAEDERRMAWEMATSVRRDSESTLAAVAQLGLSGAQVDAMFIEAAQVE